jgi:hypothetical protein
MIEQLFEQLFGNMFSVVGSASLGVLLIMVVLFLGMLYCGLEFDFALVILSPIPYAFNKAGYLDVWVTALFIIIPLGVGIWSIWVKFTNKNY